MGLFENIKRLNYSISSEDLMGTYLNPIQISPNLPRQILTRWSRQFLITFMYKHYASVQSWYARHVSLYYGLETGLVQSIKITGHLASFSTSRTEVQES